MVMLNEAPKSFREASEAFCKFLQKNGYPEQVIWAGRTDLVWGRSKLWVRDYTDLRTWDEASKRYCLGVEHGLGVCLEAFASTKDAVIAKVFVPKDEDVMERSLTPRGGLKLVAAVKTMPARRVTSSLGWIVLSRWYRESTISFLGLIEIFAEA
jgi:hypothetical protein